MPLNTNMHCATGEYTLFRFPKNQHDAALQAWDSADELVIDYIQSHFDNQYLAILNDQFGAITVALNQFNRTLITDSHISKLATVQNCDVNKLPEPIFISSIEPIPAKDVVVLKLTKSMAFLEDQLQQLQVNNANVELVACGKTTQVTSSVLALFSKYCIDVKTSLAKKKSRLIFATIAPATRDDEHARLSHVHWPELDFSIAAYANVFSHDGLDIGGRFMASNLPTFTDGQVVVDLGCGNGLLGLATLKQCQQTNTSVLLKFVDESTMAVASAEYNVDHIFPEQRPNCKFSIDDCLTKQQEQSVDVVLCNPPFHQQNTLTEHIAKQMFRQAKLALKDNGELYVVANHHLPYKSYLKKMFSGFKVLVQNKKFVIYQCTKRI